MVDFNPPTKPRKGFYVKMKFLHSNHRHGRPKDNNIFKRNFHHFYYRFFKWILWIFLSFYLFFSFPSFKHSNHLHKFKQRSLIESSPSFEASLAKSDLNLKVYVYELPEKYNEEWLKNERCSKHLFASEVAIHKALLKSEIRTLEPNEADLFFVPVYVSCNFSTINGFPAIGHARSLISSAVHLISLRFPFWNRTRGSDHVFVASHDFGACFHTLDVAKEDGIPEILRKSIILQTFGVKYKHPCQEVENVVIPPYVPPQSIRSTLVKWPLGGTRDIFAFFRGKMEINPKNVSGRFYSKAVRTKIWKKFNNDKRFYLKRNRYSGYQSEIARSIFCLCPLGWAPWSPRLVESVALGCVPVIIADGIRLPFDDVVPWSNISLTVAENDVVNLGKILDHVARTNLTTIQRNLWDPYVRGALLFNPNIHVGDATWHVLRSLRQKLPRGAYGVSQAHVQ
ncbi:hypothetical protein RND81_09G182200 [Saponaria officinalis]|uniref:Exostosin GT47 domain-containing protein n=1 Tax=Saponaria officinalis TaxID=3572 RepID=A0AAW1IP93_SAPOF